jgi:hypothetical protein
MTTPYQHNLHNLYTLGDKKQRKRIPDISEALERDRKLGKFDIKQETTEEPAEKPLPVTTNIDINPREYIQIPTTSQIIAINQSYNNLNYLGTHKALLESGLKMPEVPTFMKHFTNVVNAYNQNSALYYADGSEVNRQITEELYNKLTSNCWIWLNAGFKQGTGFNNMNLETVLGMKNDGSLVVNGEPLEPHLNETCHVDLEFNSQGLPIRKSSNQEYNQGENMCFWKPIADRVARFGAGSAGADLYCDRYPQYRVASLGVFACAEGAR